MSTPVASSHRKKHGDAVTGNTLHSYLPFTTVASGNRSQSEVNLSFSLISLISLSLCSHCMLIVLRCLVFLYHHQNENIIPPTLFTHWRFFFLHNPQLTFPVTVIFKQVYIKYNILPTSSGKDGLENTCPYFKVDWSGLIHAEILQLEISSFSAPKICPATLGLSEGSLKSSLREMVWFEAPKWKPRQ